MAELVGVGLEGDEEADVVDHSGEEGFVGEGDFHFLGEVSGGDADGDAVGPEVFCGEAIAEFDALEELAEGGGDGDVFDGVEAEEDDGAFDGGDLAGEAVEGAVDDFEDSGDEGGVVGDDFVECGGVGVGVFDGGDNAGGDFGEGGDVVDLFDHLEGGGLRIG